MSKIGRAIRPRALITGITGMVGSHLADFLLAHTDWDIYGLCRWRSPLDNIEHLLWRVNGKDRMALLYADLRDYISIQVAVEASRPDYVFHLAAQSYPHTSFISPLDTLDVNVQGTERLLEALRQCQGINPLIHVCSSSEVFGRVGKEHIPINEECRFYPASPYAISKVGTDLIGRYHAHAYKQRVLVTRMFTHTGPRRGDVFAESSFAKQIAMIEADIIEPIIHVGNLYSTRTWADVRDAVRAYYMLLTVDPIPGEYYNIGGTHITTVKRALEYLVSLSPCSGKIDFLVDPERVRLIDADLQIPDTTKFREHTGWTPEIPFEETMLDLLEYWRDKIKKGRQCLTR